MYVWRYGNLNFQYFIIISRSQSECWEQFILKVFYNKIIIYGIHIYLHVFMCVYVCVYCYE